MGDLCLRHIEGRILYHISLEIYHFLYIKTTGGTSFEVPPLRVL